MRTIVTNTYEVVIDNMKSTAAFSTRQDAEDDIVSAAVFVYNMEASFGDDFTTTLDVHWNEAEKCYVVLDNDIDPSLAHLGNAVVTVRASTHRF